MSDKAAGKRKAHSGDEDEEVDQSTAEDVHQFSWIALRLMDNPGHSKYFVRCVEHGDPELIERLLKSKHIDPAANKNEAVQIAALRGHLAVIELLLQDERVDPSDNNNYAVRMAAEYGDLAVLEQLLQDKRVDPSDKRNYAVRLAAENGHRSVLERLMRDARVDPSANNNEAIAMAAANGDFAVIEQLLQDDRVDAAVGIQNCDPDDHELFECRERLTEICIGLQDMQLPAWVTLQILDAARPWSTLQLHSKWALACAVKHFHDRRPRTTD